MSYKGMIRSNYFQVRNVYQFRQFCNVWGLKVIASGNTVGFIVDVDSSFSLDHYYENHSRVEANFFAELASLLCDNEIAIVMEAGYDHSYVVGWAKAVRNDGQVIYLELDDIYRQVTERFGVDTTMVIN